ncbi:MAG: N-acetyltransferase [Succinivibrio sp.]|jgi:argininosuccinate lyase/amino-acid N-acetyltransferase|nr:N-acetyltransferase [Succinivibrio sp.]
MADLTSEPQHSVILDELRGLTIDEIFEKATSLYNDGQLNDSDMQAMGSAVVTVNRIFSKQEQHHFFIRQATLEDVDSLMEMVDFWAKHGQNLPRKRQDIIRNIQTFAVCVRDGEVVGCACLYVYDSGLAEIRSLGVSPIIQRQGQGRAIVEFLLKRAARMAIKRVFVLTRSPKFFSRVGFTRTVRESLPEKILKDCENCPRRENCDEIAYIREIPSLNI